MIKGRFAKLSISATFILLALLGAPNSQAQNPNKPDLVITILHTNDLHAHEDSFSERGKFVGGTARLTNLIRSIRKSTPNVLTIDAGDIFQGTAYFKFHEGATEVAYLNRAGYDIYTIGNHEFDNGSENLAKQLKNAKFEIISANLDATKMPELAKLVKPSVIKTIEGKRIGFVGGITPDLEQISLTTGDVHVKNGSPEPSVWVQPIADEVKRLQDQGVDKIILVTHCGLDRDKQLAELIPGVDAIIGGHSHTRLDKPVIVDHTDGTSCTIVQTGCYGRALGKLTLAFDNQGRVMNQASKYNLIPITQNLSEAQDVKAYLDEMSRPLQAMRNQTVGYALGDFENHFHGIPRDTSMGNLISDAVAESGKKYGATIAFHNRGGIRGRFDKGPITLEKVEEILPFNNQIVVATITGAKLKNVLEHAVSGSIDGKFLNVHGLKFGYDANKPSGDRITYVSTEDTKGSWHKLDPHKTYTIAINDYNFNGGEGFDFTGATNVQITHIRLSHALASYLQKHPKVAPQWSRRIYAEDLAENSRHRYYKSKGPQSATPAKTLAPVN